MSFLVLALGSLMSVVGIILLAIGYPVIEVERGWASVISGSTLLAGGVVTAALGLLLRTVDGIREALRDGRAAVSPAPLGEPPRLEPVPAAPPETTPWLERDWPEAKETSPEMEAAMEAPAPEDVSAQPAPRPALVSPPPSLAVTEPATIEPEAAHTVAVEPAAETGLATVSSEPDWLDRSFAEFDRENADLTAHVPTEPALPPEPHPAPVHAEPHPVVTAQHANTAESTGTIIGRYEADGTSYVMYADGSIEASSPAGVYRFASMAELKSFIEG